SISRPRLEPIRETQADKVSDRVHITTSESEATRREPNIEEDVATRAAHERNEALGTSLSEAVDKATHAPENERETPTEPLEASAESTQAAETAAEAETEKQQDNQPQVDALLLVASGRRVYAIDPLAQRTLQDAHLELK